MKQKSNHESPILRNGTRRRKGVSKREYSTHGDLAPQTPGSGTRSRNLPFSSTISHQPNQLQKLTLELDSDKEEKKSQKKNRRKEAYRRSPKPHHINKSA